MSGCDESGTRTTLCPWPTRVCLFPASGHAAGGAARFTVVAVAVAQARRAVGAGAYPGVVHEAGAGEIRPEDRYDDLVDELAGIAGVTPLRGTDGFGRTALRFQNKIFVMLVRGHLVLKLPAERIDALVAAGDGVRFDASKGMPMKEWLSLAPESGEPWLLAHEALDFARSGR